MNPPQSVSASTPPESYPHKWGVMLAIGLGVLMGTIDMSIVTLALPTLSKELNTNFGTIQWIVLSYVLVMTSMMLGMGRLGDMYNKKRVYIIGLVIFTIGSLLCGLAPNVYWLIGFRGIQGFGAVMIQALGTAIVVEVFPPNERGRAMGIIGTIVSVGIALGPALGGIIIGMVGWRWIFYVNIPVGIIAFVVALKSIPTSISANTGETFDKAGAVILLFTLLAFALGMTLGQNTGFGHLHIQIMLLGSVLGLILFIALEKRMIHPMVDLSLFKNVIFSLGLIMGFLSFLTFGGMFLMPFFLQLVKGYSIQQVGLMMIISPIAMGLTSPVSGALSDKFGTRGLSILGLVILIGACLSISTLHPDISVLGYLIRIAPLGIGMGVFQSPNNSAIMGSVPPNRLGVASGLLALSRTLGNTTGIPLMGAVFTTTVLIAANMPELTNPINAPTEALMSGIRITFLLAAGLMTIATILSVITLVLERKGNQNKSRA